jgi:hypothetical protein
VLAAALAGTVVAGFLLAASAGVVLEAHQRVEGAADAAALAGADVELGAATGLPCDAASAMARHANVRLDRCAVRGPLVRVRLSTDVLGLALAAEAVAGPPPPR